MPLSTDSNSPPWYRQFWPWFLIALPGTVVVASLVMVYIAFSGADSLVVDNYYRDGLAINQVLEQDRRAEELGLSAALRLDATSGELLLTIDAAHPLPEQLALLLFHPIDSKRDLELVLTQITRGHYRTDLEQQLQSRYYLRVLPEPGREWRLIGELDFATADQIILRAE
ncbi:FixH family protein [uncultured Porticoccus sp.]|uniref:FixH family protein n=1 Tax=uncultured Porticoccus sp. TaxID=1256050 RepID=UPI0030DD7E71